MGKNAKKAMEKMHDVNTYNGQLYGCSNGKHKKEKEREYGCNITSRGLIAVFPRTPGYAECNHVHELGAMVMLPGYKPGY